jgi:hypothetical protein
MTDETGPRIPIRGGHADGAYAYPQQKLFVTLETPIQRSDGSEVAAECYRLEIVDGDPVYVPDKETT